MASMESLMREREATLEIERRQNSLSYEHRRVQRELLSATQKGMLFEEKTRLGSEPPSCHNKCNYCHPCVAVQVPTISSHERRVEPGMTRTIPMMFFDPSHPGTNKYSNYKPLGWKCHCGDHFFNP